jgi:hypothetical protein
MTLTLTPLSAPEPDPTVPKRVDRATGARLVTLHYFPTSPRALENWELDWLVVNGKATCETEALFAAAQAKLDVARRRVTARALPHPADELGDADLNEEVEAALRFIIRRRLERARQARRTAQAPADAA